MAGIGQAACKEVVVKVVRDFLGNNDAARRYVTRIDAFCEGDEIGNNAILLERKPATWCDRNRPSLHRQSAQCRTHLPVRAPCI
jgi:hypothetical protein